MISSVIFDIDGTLIDSNDLHALAWQRAFQECGKDVAFKKIRARIGEGSDQLLPHFLNPEEIKKLGETIAEKRSKLFRKDYLAQVRPFAKVRELFKALRERDVKIALASSSDKKEVEQYKIIAQITDLVEHSTSADDADKSKPHPDIFQAALRELKNPPSSSVLVVGDTPYDAIAAVKAKLKCIGLLCGGFSEQELKAGGCARIFNDPEQLLENLDSILS